jgi:glycosyltransferase involved in cell wall biosynthesis
MRILWHSNSPWSATGYGNQTKLVVPRLQALGHTMAISAFYGLQGGILDMGGIPVYPGGGHAFGADVLPAHAKHFKADIVISLVDPWVMPPSCTTKFRWIPWTPVDCWPMNHGNTQAIKGNAFKVISMAHFGYNVAQAAGIESTYIPHGIDTSVFRPIDRAVARQNLGMDPERMVVLMVAANKGVPPRKSFGEAIEGFARWRAKYRKDAILFLHTDASGYAGGVPLSEMIDLVDARLRSEGIEPLPQDCIAFPEQYRYRIGYPDEFMVNLYNAADVLLAPSRGEGFGIPLIEAQACGCPVIVTDFSAMSELCGSGWLVNGQLEYSPAGAYWMVPSVRDIIEALKRAGSLKGALQPREQAREFALEYDADKVVEAYWKPFLDGVEREIARAVPPAPDIVGDFVGEVA